MLRENRSKIYLNNLLQSVKEMCGEDSHKLEQSSRLEEVKEETKIHRMSKARGSYNAMKGALLNLP